MVEVGQAVYIVPRDRKIQEWREYSILTVGRKWVSYGEASIGREYGKFNREDFEKSGVSWVDGGRYSSPAVAFSNLELYHEFKLRGAYKTKFLREITCVKWDKLPLSNIEVAAKLLNIPLED